MRIAITRPVPASLARCELTHLARVPSNRRAPSAQHAQYEEALRVARMHRASCAGGRTNCRIRCLSRTWRSCSTRSRSSPGPAPRHAVPSATRCSLFLPNTGRCRPSWRRERSMAATCCGSAGRSMSGCSTRTNEDGVRNSRRHVAPFGYSVVECVRTAGLSAPQVGGHGRRCRPRPLQPGLDRRARARAGVDVIAVDPAEPHAANVLRVGHAIVCAAQPRADSRRPAVGGYDVCAVDVSELAKAEAGVTCCSVDNESSSQPSAAQLSAAKLS